LNKLIYEVEEYTTLSGSQKKMLVLDTFKKIIDEQYGNSPDDYLEKQLLLSIIDYTVSQFIDTLFSAINGEMTFRKNKTNKTNKTKNNISNLFASLKKLFSCNKTK